MIKVGITGQSVFIGSHLYNTLALHGDRFKSIPFKKEYFKSLFKEVTINYYGFFTLLFLPFYKSPERSIIFSFISKIDKVLFKIPFFKFLAWSILIEGKK